MHTPASSGRRLPRAFSLLEVMVVMTVLAVLAALLLPAFRSARNTADSVRCSSTLNQWGVAFSLYATDNGGYYPISWINNSDHWLNFVSPYVDPNWMSYELLTSAKRIDNKKAGCPYYAKFVHPADPLYRNFPYSYNAARFDYPYGDLSYCENIPGGPYKKIKGIPARLQGWVGWLGQPLPDSAHWDVAGAAFRYNGLPVVEKVCHVPPTLLYKNQAQCVTMFCGIASCWRYMSNPYAFWFSGGGGADWEVRTGDYLYTDANGISAYDYNGAPLGVHNGRDNYLFMDGHVETLSLDDPNLNKYVFNEIPNDDNPYR